MNTITHPLSTWWLVRNRVRPGLAAFGSVAPDLPYLVALAGGLAEWLPKTLSGLPLKTAIGEAVMESWCNPVTNFLAQKILHCLVFAAVFAAIAVASRKPALHALALGWALHVWADFSVHVNDAYPVLYPFTRRVFPSPVSYWDPDHHGKIAGAILGLMATALWIWLGRRWWRGQDLPRRAGTKTRRLLVVVAVLMAAAPVFAIVGTTFWFNVPERSARWVDDGMWEAWPDGLAPAADAISAGDPEAALTTIRSQEGADPSREGVRMHEPERARRLLLEGYALDLAGRRADAVECYFAAERLEPEGTIGDKARRYEGEPYRNVPDPPVGAAWAGLWLAGLALCGGLLVSLPESAKSGTSQAAPEG